jgi:hypothetical protein
MMHRRIVAYPITIFVVALLGAWLAASPPAEDKDGQSTIAAGNQREAGLVAWQQIYAVLTFGGKVKSLDDKAARTAFPRPGGM